MGKVKKFLRKFEPAFKGIAKKIEPHVKKRCLFLIHYFINRETIITVKKLLLFFPSSSDNE